MMCLKGKPGDFVTTFPVHKLGLDFLDLLKLNQKLNSFLILPKFQLWYLQRHHQKFRDRSIASCTYWDNNTGGGGGGNNFPIKH